MFNKFQPYQILILSGLFFMYYGLTEWNPFILLYHGGALGLALTCFILAFLNYSKKK